MDEYQNILRMFTAKFVLIIKNIKDFDLKSSMPSDHKSFYIPLLFFSTL